MSTSSHPAQRAIDEDDFVFDLHPFRVFCVYHLGLDDEGNARFMNGPQAARLLGVSLDDMQEVLEHYRMDPEVILHSDFDLASAQADIQVSPPGVDLVGLAEMHFEAFLASKEGARDWSDEIDRDVDENDRTYR